MKKQRSGSGINHSGGEQQGEQFLHLSFLPAMINGRLGDAADITAL